MRKSNTGLRALMAAASLAAFLGGWVMFGHAPNPTLSNTTASATVSGSRSPAQLQPGSGLIQLPSSAASQSTGTRLRTGGS